MKPASVSWDELKKRPTITPEHILEITLRNGHDVEELVQYLDVQHPGLLEATAEAYLDAVIASLPQGVVPRKDHICTIVYKGKAASLDDQQIRDIVTALFYGKVHKESPGWAKRGFAAAIEFYLGNYFDAMFEAGFTECEFLTPDFPERMAMDTPEAALPFVLKATQRKAEVFIPIYTRLRSATTT